MTTVNYKLIVQNKETCIDLLKYLDKNIVSVNRLGATVKIEKIDDGDMDDDLVETFRKNGITRLPVLIGPDGTKFIGLKRVIDLFEKNLNTHKNQGRANPLGGVDDGPAAEFGSNPDLGDFYMKELFSGQDRHGAMIPRKDKDEDGVDEGLGNNFERGMAEQNKRARHRLGEGNERNNDPAPQRRPRNTREESSDEDNVADDYDNEPPARGRRGGIPNLPATGDTGGDDMDQRMLAAWMDNNDGA